MSQIRNPFESSSNKITPDVLVKFLKEMYAQYNHRVNTRREYCSRLICKDGKVIPDQMIRVGIAEELSKVLDDVTDQFLLFGEIIIKEGK